MGLRSSSGRASATVAFRSSRYSWAAVAGSPLMVPARICPSKARWGEVDVAVDLAVLEAQLNARGAGQHGILVRDGR